MQLYEMRMGCYFLVLQLGVHEQGMTVKLCI